MNLILPLIAALPLAPPGGEPLSAFADLVRTDTWTEVWPDAQGAPESRTVTAELWTAAMQATLEANGSLHIPAREMPYYLDGPLVLRSGQTLTADAEAEIRLKPGCNTCMVRNEHVASFNDRPVPADAPLDTDIRVEGGIWTTLATGVSSNGNEWGLSSREQPAFGTHGTILLENVRRVSVRDVTIRQCRPFGVHLANAHEFTVEGMTLDRTGRDGVHVNGPASDGVVRGVHGDSADDVVALNAWEWKNYAPSFGPIERVLVEDVSGAPDGVPSANAIRLLPGVKRFDDGSTLDCSIAEVTFRRVRDICELKAYAQPNLELGRANDASVGVGHMRDIRFEGLRMHRPGKIELHADCDGLTIEDVRIYHPISPEWHLIAIGPPSRAYPTGAPDDTSRWVELFEPDLDCTVRNVRVTGVYVGDSDEELPLEQVVEVIEQKINPDYPRTAPRGGTGRGIWIR